MPKELPSKIVKLHGRVGGFNLSPKGEIEGVLLETDTGPAQINLAKGQTLPEAWVEGAMLDLEVKSAPSHGEHPIYDLVGGDEGATGKIARLNYARHGEVNGFVLDDGTFIHLKPEGAKRFRALKVGDRIHARGHVRVGSQARVIDADHVDDGSAKRAPRPRTAASA